MTHETIYAAVHITASFRDDIGTSKDIHGTAFGLMLDNGKMAMVTNRHMVDLNFGRKDSKYARFELQHLVARLKTKNSDTGRPDGSVSLVIPVSHNVVRYDSNQKNDIALIYDVQSGNLDGSTNRRWDFCFRIQDVASEDELAHELHPCDFLVFPGYPYGHDKSDLRAIVRWGTVACDPRYQYSFETEDRGDILLYEGFSFGGSSGSPVIAIPKVPPINVDPHPQNQFRRMMVVGVNAGHLTSNEGGHAGLSYFIKSSVIHRILNALVT